MSISFLNQAPITLAESEQTPLVRAQILRTGTFRDPRYGEFSITKQMMQAMVENFARNAYRQKIYIDVAHKPEDGAAAEVKSLALECSGESCRLVGNLEFTPFGLEAVKERGFRYLSAEYADNYTDNESGASLGPLLIGGGLTIRPVQKGQNEIVLSECSLLDAEQCRPASSQPEEVHTMKLNDVSAKLRQDLGGLNIPATTADTLVQRFEAKAKTLSEDADLQAWADTYYDAGKTVAAGIEDGKQAVTVTLSDPAPVAPAIDQNAVAQMVQKQLAEIHAAEQEKNRKLAEAVTAKKDIFAQIVNGAEISAEAKALAIAEAGITHDMPDGVVKRLAETAVQLAHVRETQGAADYLAARGGVGGGAYGRVSVSHANEVKELSEHIRMATGMAKSEPRTEANKKLADAVLAEFDRNNAPELLNEHKLMKQLAGRYVNDMRDIKRLAAGSAVAADASVPTSYVREVIRETLYQMVGLEMCDVGTREYSNIVDIAYSYRDTTSAGGASTGVLSPKASTRIYEGSAIGKAQEIMTSENTYPIPIKLSVKMSDEYRLLAGYGRDWDAIADNMRNTVRVVGEAKDASIFDEILQASDEYSTVAVSNENLELQADDAKTIFITAQWPICRPRIVKDVAGSTVSTTNAVTVTYNSVALSEYDGTGTQAAGTYYVLNHNLGEIYLVNQAGAVQTPANGTAYTISYTYTTNVAKFDTDLGTDTTKVKWSAFLYQYGLRQALITDSRYHMANMGIMSRTVMNQIRQAENFQYCYKDGTNTNLRADGSLGFIWDTENFNSRAPGLWLGDNRLVIGEKGTTRFRMLKPWSMGELENLTDFNGNFTGQKGAYGSEWVAIHTPTQLKAAYTSIVLYSATARVAR
jgi:hypothetical protein